MNAKSWLVASTFMKRGFPKTGATFKGIIRVVKGMQGYIGV